MEVPEPKSILDLGVGVGNLSLAARKRWQEASIITVDVDPLSQGLNLTSLHHHICGDALDLDLPQKIVSRFGELDVAICNPPYIRPEWQSHFNEILKLADLVDDAPVFKENRAELLFLAQNIRATRIGGHIGLIVPDGPVSGLKYRSLRKTLLNKHQVEYVISLPRGAFKYTEAKAHILIMRKGISGDGAVGLSEIRKDGGLADPIRVDYSECIERLDYAYHKSKLSLSSRHRYTTLKDIGASISRGGFCSREVRESDYEIFHTTSFSQYNNLSSVDLSNSSKTSSSIPKAVYASQGDYLIARVDRKLEEKVCYVKNGSMLLSDCVYRIRAPKVWSTAIGRSLLSGYGKNWLQANSRGVGAKYMNLEDLYKFPVALD
jgi:type I restriction enzyme M protein